MLLMRFPIFDEQCSIDAPPVIDRPTAKTWREMVVFTAAQPKAIRVSGMADARDATLNAPKPTWLHYEPSTGPKPCPHWLPTEGAF